MIAAVELPTSPTGRFLLSCLRPAGDLAISSERSVVDWAQLIEWARRNGVAPLVYRRLAHATAGVPAAALDRLRHAYYQNVAANEVRYRELKQIIAALDTAGIPAVVLKGAALALTIYPDPSLRIMGDLDLLVRREHVAGALAALARLGYSKPDRGWLYSPEFLMRFGRHLPLQRLGREGALELEIHWTVIGELWAGSATAVDVAGLWARAVPLTGQGWSAYQLAPPDALLHLALHATLLHAFTELGLRIYVDVDRLVQCYAVGEGATAFWDQVIAQAQAQRLATALYFTLTLSGELLGTPLPAPVLRALRPRAWQRRAFERTVRADDLLNQARPFQGRAKWRLRLMLLDGWRDAARALGRAFSPSGGWYYLKRKAET